MSRPHRGKLVPTRASARLTGRDSQQSQRGDSLKHLCQPTWRKSLPAYPQRHQKTPHHLRSCEGLLRPSSLFCATPHHGERSASHRWPPQPCHQAARPWHLAAHSPGSARPLEDPLGVLRLRHQSRALLVSSAQARLQEVETYTKTSQSPTPARMRLHTPSTGLFRPTQSGTQEADEGPPQPPPCGSFIQAVLGERRRSGHKEGGLFHRPGAWQTHCAPPPPSWWARLGLPDGALQSLSCRSLHPGNLKELRHNPDFEGR